MSWRYFPRCVWFVALLSACVSSELEPLEGDDSLEATSDGAVIELAMREVSGLALRRTRMSSLEVLAVSDSSANVMVASTAPVAFGRVVHLPGSLDKPEGLVLLREGQALVASDSSTMNQLLAVRW